MSAKSAPSAYTSGGGSVISNENRIVSVMLNKYLANPPTITEKLAVPQAPKKKAAEVVEEKKDEAKEFLRNWQASWDDGE